MPSAGVSRHGFIQSHQVLLLLLSSVTDGETEAQDAEVAIGTLIALKGQRLPASRWGSLYTIRLLTGRPFLLGRVGLKPLGWPLGLRRLIVLVPHIGRYNRTPKTERLTNNRKLFLAVLEVGKSMIKVLAELVSGEGLLFAISLHGRRGKGDL